MYAGEPGVNGGLGWRGVGWGGWWGGATKRSYISGVKKLTPPPPCHPPSWKMHASLKYG